MAARLRALRIAFATHKDLCAFALGWLESPRLSLPLRGYGQVVLEPSQAALGGPWCSVAECRDGAKTMTTPARGRVLLRRVRHEHRLDHLLRGDGPDSAFTCRQSGQDVRSALKAGQDVGIFLGSEAANGKSRSKRKKEPPP